MSEWFGDGNVLLLVNEAKGRTSATFYRKSSENGLGLSPSFPVFLDTSRESPGNDEPPEERRRMDGPVEQSSPRIPAAERRRTLTGVHVGLLFAVAAVVMLGALQYRTFLLIDQRSDTPRVSENLDLKTERSGGDGQWRLSWNRSAPAIQKAEKGHVSIIDGYLRKEIDLTAADVQTGGIVYWPVADDVTFRLEVFDSRAGRAVSESVRVLASPWPYAEAAGVHRAEAARPSPDYNRYSTLARAGVTGREIGGDSSRGTALPSDSKPAPATEASGRAPALKPFTPPSTAREPLIVSRTVNDLPVPPTPQPHAPSSDTTIPPAVAAPLAGPKPPAEFTATADTSANFPDGTVSTGGHVESLVEPPVLLSRTTPRYPALASQGHIGGIVKLEATIGIDGRLHNPKVLSGHLLLRNAAIEAIKEWSYRPARLNGRSVPTLTMVEIRYAPPH